MPALPLSVRVLPAHDHTARIEDRHATITVVIATIVLHDGAITTVVNHDAILAIVANLIVADHHILTELRGDDAMLAIVMHIVTCNQKIVRTIMWIKTIHIAVGHFVVCPLSLHGIGTVTKGVNTEVHELQLGPLDVAPDRGQLDFRVKAHNPHAAHQ